jgi:ribosomal-protein-alanine N-acetyltransferase
MAATDLDRVIEIAASEKGAPRWTRAMYAASSDPQSLPKRVALVAEDPDVGKLVGFVVASGTAPEAELETIVTASAFQRQGVARKLFAEIAGELRALAAREILLEVRESNQPARDLYISLGFLETGRRRGYYTEPIEDALQMRLELL